MTTITASRADYGSVAWPQPVPIAPERVIHGAPAAETVILQDSLGHQLGLWRVSAGEFTTDHPDYVEYIHIVEGTGQLIDDQGTVTDLTAGTTVLMPAGWKGRWLVTERITKVYTIISTGDSR